MVACLAAAGCASAQRGSERIDPALASLVPSDTLTLVGVRFDQLRTTPFYRKWVAERPLPAVENFAKETGIDLRKDIWELLVASNGKDSVALVRGKFSSTGEEPRIDRPGVRRTPYKGYTLIGNDDGAVVFMNASTAVAGRPAAVRAIIDQRGRAGGSAPVFGLVKEIPARNQVWAASTGGFSQVRSAAPDSGNIAGNLGRMLSMVETFTAAADLRTGLNAIAEATCRTEQDARSLHDAIRGFIGLGRLSTPDNQPDMLRVYDAMQVEQQQRTVRFRADVPENLLDKVMAQFTTGSRP